MVNMISSGLGFKCREAWEIKRLAAETRLQGDGARVIASGDFV